MKQEIKRECNDATVAARLKEMAGHRYQPGTMADYFGVSCKAMTARLRFMAANDLVKRGYENGHTVYYWPGPEDIARESAVIQGRPFRPYVVPQAMRDILARIAAERDAIPSKFHSEVAA
jgi:hypothetical protein